MNDTAAVVGADTTAAPAAAPAAAEGPMTFEKMISGKSSNGAQNPIGDPKPDAPQDESEGDGGELEDLEDDGQGDDDSDIAASGDDEGGPEDEGEGEKPGKAKSQEEDLSEGKDEEADTQDLESLKTSGKSVVAKVDGKEVKIPLNAKVDFETKDGKKITGITIKEALNNYTTAADISRQQNSLHNEKRSFQAEKREAQKIQLEHEEMEENLSLLREAAEGRNMFNMAQAVLNIFSKGDQTIAQELFAGISALTKQVGEWDEDTLKSKINQSQLEFKTKTLEKESKKKDSQLQSVKNKEWVADLIAEHGISWTEYHEGWQYLKEADGRRKAAGIPVIIKDTMEFKDIALETIKYVKASKTYTRAATSIHRVAPKSKFPKLHERVGENKLIQTVVKYAEDELTDPKFSDKDLDDVVRGVIKNLLPQKKKLATQPRKEAPSLNGNPPKTGKGPSSTEANPKEKEKRREGDEPKPMTFARMLGKEE